MTYTEAELKQTNMMRRQEIADSQRVTEAWQLGGTGWKEEGTEYFIEYRTRGYDKWLSCSPFFRPLSTHPGWTHDPQQAHDVAAAMLRGEHPPHHQAKPGDEEIIAVRVGKRYSSAEVIGTMWLD